MMTVKEVAELLGVCDKHVYRLLVKCQENKEDIFIYGDYDFFIHRTPTKVLLQPMSAMGVNMCEIENRAIMRFIDQLIPCVCRSCAVFLEKQRPHYAKYVPEERQTPAAVPEPAAQAIPEAVPAPEPVSCIVTTHTTSTMI